MFEKLSIIPAPARLVIRPFDTLSESMQRLGIVLPDNAVHGRNTSGLVVVTHRGPQSIMVETEFTVVSDAGTPLAQRGEDHWINVGDQVVFPAMSGNEITVPEPTEKEPRRQQRYILIQERDVIAKIVATAPVEDVNVEPRQYVSG